MEKWISFPVHFLAEKYCFEVYDEHPDEFINCIKKIISCAYIVKTEKTNLTLNWINNAEGPQFELF